MDRNKINVLYIIHDSKAFGGAARSCLDMVSAISEHVNPFFLVLENGPLVDYLKSKDFRFYIRYFQSLITREKNWKYYLGWSKIFAKYKRDERHSVQDFIKVLEADNVNIDIVHSNSSIFSYGHTLAKGLGAKHVWHIREFLDLDFGYKVLYGKKRLRRLINSSDAIIAISNAVDKHWQLRRQNKSVIYDAVKNPCESNHLPSKNKIVLFCATNVTERKGIFTCIKAFAKSKIYQNGYKLRIVGRCEPQIEKDIKELSSFYRISEFVELVGFKNDVKRELAEASIFIMSSMCEALGRITVEAMMAACIVIGANAGATPEIITDGETGFIFSSIDECAKILKDVIDRDCSNIIHKSQKQAETVFSEDLYRKHILDIYDLILHRSNRLDR